MIAHILVDGGGSGGCRAAPHLHGHLTQHSWRWLSSLDLFSHGGAWAPHRLSLETRLVTEQPWGCLTDGVYQSLINLPTWGSGWNPTFTHEETEVQRDPENYQDYLRRARRSWHALLSVSIQPPCSCLACGSQECSEVYKVPLGYRGANLKKIVLYLF